MSNASEFLRRFGFIEGRQFDGYILEYVSVSHEEINKCQSYIITLTFKNNGRGTYNDLLKVVREHISAEHLIGGTHVVYPYRCVIDPPHQNYVIENRDGSITYKLKGHCLCYHCYLQQR